MSNILNYKGYIGLIMLDSEEKIFHGEVINIRDVITFQGKSIEELETAFQESVEDYLDFCKEEGEEPNKPYSGNFIVRLQPEHHKLVSIAAKLSGKSLNSWVSEHLYSDAKKELHSLSSHNESILDFVR